MQGIPVRRAGRLIALLTREAAVTFARQTGELERTYLETFERFALMVADGSFPFDLDEVETESEPRVGDGVILIDAETRVKFASPNAVSLLHRLGIHTYAHHAHLSDISFDDDSARGAMRRHLPVSTEIERDDVSMLLRVLPLFEDDVATGALLLMRDVSDLRRRDRMLLSKDRDDPRDPSPREEQSADDRVAAPAPGPALAVARGPSRARRVGAPDPIDRDRARNTLSRRR